jgi:tripartite-type tricarboxylate transporter receptor subunit TctC
MGAVHHAIAPSMYPKLDYSIENDFIPVGLISSVPQVIVVNPQRVAATDLKSFLELVRKNPGKLNYASAGIGTLPHITMELLLRRTGIQVAHIPYRGAAPAMNDLLSGQVQLKLDTYTTSHPHVVAGKLRMLGIASRARSKLMPDTPTIAEMGLPGYEGILWIGMVAPAGTPKAVVDKLAAANARAARAADVVERFAKIGVDPVGGTTAEFAALIARELPQWRELVKAANIKAQ